MSRALHFIADQPGEYSNERVDAFLARLMPEHSRSFWQKLCEQGDVTSAGKPLKPSYQLKIGEEITVILPELPDFSQHTLPVLYEDDDVLVINKPAGLLTHAKGALSNEFSVAEFVRPRTTDSADTNRPGIVHRLDRGTSGVIITAKHSEAKRWLQTQFSQRKTKKTYIALVEGRPKQSEAMLKLPIERNPKKPQTFRVGANGKPADTAYQTKKTFAAHTLLRLEPLTGRTHQLRVHLAYLGHPIVGDELYGAKKSALERIFLHAASLELTLPSRQRKTFRAPLPAELTQFLEALDA